MAQPAPSPARRTALLAVLARNRGEIDAETLRRLLVGLTPEPASR